MTININNNLKAHTDSIPEAPPFEQPADVVAREVDELVKRGNKLSPTPKQPAKLTAEAHEARERAEVYEHFKVRMILKDPRLTLLSKFARIPSWKKIKERLNSYDSINEYFEKEFLPNYKAILALVGDKQMNLVLSAFVIFKRAIRQVRDRDPVETEAALSEHQAAHNLEKSKKREQIERVKRALADPQLGELESLLLETLIGNRDPQKKLTLCSQYFKTRFLPDFEGILATIGYAKMDKILNDLHHLNAQTNNFFAEVLALFAEKLGLSRIEAGLATAVHEESSEKKRAAIVSLMEELDDLLHHYPTLEKLFSPTLRQLFDHYKKIKADLGGAIAHAADAFILSQKGPEKLFKLIKKYRYLDVDYGKGEIRYERGSIKKAMMAHLPIDSLQDPEKLSAALADSYAQFSQSYLKAFTAFMQDQCQLLYGARYAWIKNNQDRIKASYSQVDQVHTNVKEGTCLQNACERYAQLLDHPSIPTEDLKLGSSLSGRRVRATIVHELRTPHKSPQIDIYAPFGLKSTGKDLVFKPDLEDLETSLENHPGTFLFGIGAPKKNGHTINIQCDLKANKYRFIDDNFGSVEYATKAELLAQLKAYLKAFYPEDFIYKATFRNRI